MHPSTVDLLAPLFVMLGVVVLIKLILDHLLKRRLLASSLSEEMMRSYLQWTTNVMHEDALKWGFVSVAVGAALVLIDILPYTLQDSISFGLIFIFGGGALLAYRLVARRRLNP